MATQLARLSIVACIVVWLIGCAASTSEQTACELDPDNMAAIASSSEALSSSSCKMSADTGYKSGKAFKIQVVKIDGESVEWRTANAYMQMAKAAAKAGVQLRVVSGFRTMAEQKYLYGCYINCSCNGCNLAAVPGTSNHQSGHALDLNTSSPGVSGWLAKHAAKFGFKRTVPSEAWHWEWWGEDDGAGPCNADTLKAAVTNKWSTAERYRGKGAHFLACTGDTFKLGLTFRNKGSAVWRDVKGRGESVGSDVFLVTANGKADKLTGKKRFSIRNNENTFTRGDHAAPECSNKQGCRKTTFIDGGMRAKAPTKPGVYTSRWRLRDYSKIWGKSESFGPKVEIKVKVIKCDQAANECGCRVWCNDGTSQKLTAEAINSGGACKSVGETFCKPGSLVNHSFGACGATDPGGGSTDPLPGVDDPSDPSSGWTTNPLEPIDPSELEPDDPDFDDDGFDGDGDTPWLPAPKHEGCAIRAPGAATGGSLGLFVSIIGAALVLRRRRRSAAFATLAILSLGVCGCAGSDGQEPVGVAREAVSAPKKAFCQVSVGGHGTMDLEKDYLPRVITCENDGAKLEAMKAQAIAARSVAYYSMATSGSICDSQSCQVMSCGKGPSELARRAVRETSGMFLSHRGTLTYGFYVAGDSGASKPSCKDQGGATDHYVTYNNGKTGHAVDSTSLGGSGSQNRGCMSQWGARCLDNEKNFSFMNILHFYYGADINVVQAQGACVDVVDTLKAKLVRKWSNLKRFRGKKADYVACAGEDLKMAFTFRNTGSALWRDIEGGGNGVGDDVFLVTANGKPDKLTQKTRFSVALNKNAHVRGDRDSKDCTKPGCRKTTFVDGGMQAKAPQKPGLYTSRWRLRDYGKPWGKSKGFGPKVELKVRVLDCQSQGACGCRVWCTNGKSHALSADIDSDTMCKSVGQTLCKPEAAYAAHSFEACAADDDPAVSDPASDPNAGDDPDAPGNDWVEAGIEDDDLIEPDDDPDFVEDGFNGDENVSPWESAEQGCALSQRGTGSGSVLFAFATLLALGALRRRPKTETGK